MPNMSVVGGARRRLQLRLCRLRCGLRDAPEITFQLLYGSAQNRDFFSQRAVLIFNDGEFPGEMEAHAK